MRNSNLSPYSLQYSIHPPSKFIRTHSDQLLPGWSAPVLSVLIVVQPCKLALVDRTAETEVHKFHLRQKFTELGYKIVSQLQQSGHFADLFDPKTGLPMFSIPGQIRLDDVAVIRSTLGYDVLSRGGCLTIRHPVWGSAVYPSILVTSACPQTLKRIVELHLGV
ncbi:MAG: methylmalonic aciduria and homocystinuria type D protein [Leptolyngbyaceae cyanobacterium SM1_4_3]|nr:methylmalonic aciduria and homocystinuria type D protein [Leptolyngbyaceae cyanobacterium SM1_4_3]